MAEYNNIELVIYSDTRENFESAKNEHTRIGIISKTAEFWANDNYYPLVDLEDYMKKGDPIDLAIDLSGHVETSEEKFTFRTSAGNKSIRDESALIRTIKGRSIIHNQFIKNGGFDSGLNHWSATNATISTISNGLLMKNNTGSNQYISQSIDSLYNIKAGHKIFVSIDYRRSSSSSSYCTIQLTSSGSTIGSFQSVVAAATRRITSGIITATADGCDEIRVFPFRTGASGTYAYVYNVQVIDLTTMFGAGNEPSVSEFTSMFRGIFFGHELPTLRGVNILGVKTVGFNCFDKSVATNGYLDSAGDVQTSSEYKTSDFIRVIPSTSYYALNICDSVYHTSIALYDSNYKFISTLNYSNRGSNPPVNVSSSFTTTDSTTYIKICVHNSYVDHCCVNIRNSGVRDGEYEEYKSYLRYIPEIRSLFPKGMMSIGDVYDEINVNNAIRRIGVREYEDGDIDNDAFITDGYYTIYELETPEIIEYSSPIQLDYDVFDWGTEEIIIGDNPADALIADISYQFNAEGRIRDNSRNIERLEAEVKNAKPPYIIKSFTAFDLYANGETTLQMDISPDDLLGGAISRALADNCPVYIKAGLEEDMFFGVIPMTYIYQEDFIYFSFISPHDGLEYYGEIYDSVWYNKRASSPKQSNWNETDETSISYIKNKPTIPTEIATATQRYVVLPGTMILSLSPNILYDWSGLTLNSLSLPSLLSGDSAYDNKWMVRFSLSSSDNLSIPFTVFWRDGIAPSWNEWCICEMAFFTDSTGEYIYGEWKIYK